MDKSIYNDVQAPVQRGSKGMLYGGILAGLLILGLGLFLFSCNNGEEVRIATNPPGAEMLMNGKPVDDSKPLILKDGDKIQIQKRGFRATEYLHKSGDKTPKIDLNPIISEVTLATNPAGAEVVLDSKKLEGTTPLVVKDWNQGQIHDLTFTHVKQNMGLPLRFDVGEVPEDKAYTLTPLAVETKLVAAKNPIHKKAVKKVVKKTSAKKAIARKAAARKAAARKAAARRAAAKKAKKAIKK